MRIRNVKNKEEILSNATNLIMKPEELIGHWKEAFNNDNPIHVEIGMGKGSFIIEKAIANPNINFIGIERFDSIMARAIEKFPADLKNLRFIRMDAKEIDEVFDHEISYIYLNFSDPWPKKRHQKRRLTSPYFLEKYDHLFVNECHICQKTDNRQLFEYSLLSLLSYGYRLEDISLDLHHSNREDITMTEYERKFVDRGNIIYYLVVKK